MLQTGHIKRSNDLRLVPEDGRKVASAAVALLQSFDLGTAVRPVAKRCDRCHKAMPGRPVGSCCDCGSALVEEVVL